MVRSGEALAAVIIPADLFSKLQSRVEEGIGKASIEIILNTSDPLERQFVDATIKARLQDLQNTLSKEVRAWPPRTSACVLNGG